MGSLRFNDYSDSPTIFLPTSHQPFGPTSHQSHQQPMRALQPSISHQSHWKPATPTRPILYTNPSHKRSRDEDDDEPATPVFEALNPLQPVQEEPVVYGEGMTIINQSTGLAVTAESQTGTWYEENLEIERLASIEAAKSLAQAAAEVPARPTKTQRVEKLSDSSLVDSLHSASNTESQPRSSEEPALDPATHLLGVGWALMSQEQDKQAAAKGWARYIDNHYPSLSCTELLLRSEGLEAYLVKAKQGPQGKDGYFLFADDLNEGQLVADTLEKCLENLKTSLPVFEGLKTLKAVRTPVGTHNNALEELNKGISEGVFANTNLTESISVDGAMDID